MAAATAAGATLLAAAVAPRDSWRFWTASCGRPSGSGALTTPATSRCRACSPGSPRPSSRTELVWLLLAVAVAGYGLWRAARAARAGDEVAGLTLTGLVGALVSPITWPHHIYWFVPALIVLVDAGGRRDYWLFGITLTVMIFGVNTFIDWGGAPTPPTIRAHSCSGTCMCCSCSPCWCCYRHDTYQNMRQMDRPSQSVLKRLNCSLRMKHPQERPPVAHRSPGEGGPSRRQRGGPPVVWKIFIDARPPGARPFAPARTGLGRWPASPCRVRGHTPPWSRSAGSAGPAARGRAYEVAGFRRSAALCSGVERELARPAWARRWLAGLGAALASRLGRSVCAGRRRRGARRPA